MTTDLNNKNAANFTDEDKWLLANIISAMFSLEEPGRLGIRLYLDSVQMRTKYKLYKNPEIVTFEHLYHRLLDTAHDIDAFFSSRPIELMHKGLENNNYMKRVEERCIEANGNIQTFLELSADITHSSNTKPYD